MSVCPWWPEELEAWAPPEELTVSEWADRYRLLSPRTTAAPGPWRTGRVPYTREILDAFGDPWVEEITFVASTQVSKTESWLNMLLYAIDQDPAPALVVLPTDADCRKFSADRLQPAILENPRLARHCTGDPDDVKLTELHLRRMTIYLSSANSPSQLASMPIRYLFLDETDKFRAFSGQEASPIKLARERTRTFFNRKIVKTCTPTTADGYIWREYLAGDRSRFWVPCPRCGGWQVLSWRAIKWPEGERDPERVLSGRLARYECPLCGGDIADREKPAMLRAGRWVAERYEAMDPATGRVTGERPERVALRSFWVNALYSPWLTWSEIAVEFLRSRDDPAALMNFANSWLAEPWQDRVESPEVEGILALRTETPRGLVPEGFEVLTAGVDVQATGFWWCVWAWTPELACHLVDYGFSAMWDDLGALVHGRRFARAGGGADLAIWRAAVDTGGGADGEGWSRTEEVYEWLRRHGRGVAHGVKGLSTNTSPARVRPTQVGKGAPLTLWLLDTGALKDLVFWRLTRGHETGQRLTLCADAAADFARQILAEEKRRDPRTGRPRWVQIRRDNHLLDATVYAHAAADPQWAGGVRAALGRRPLPSQIPTRVCMPQRPRPRLW